MRKISSLKDLIVYCRWPSSVSSFVIWKCYLVLNSHSDLRKVQDLMCGLMKSIELQLKKLKLKLGVEKWGPKEKEEFGERK